MKSKILLLPLILCLILQLLGFSGGKGSKRNPNNNFDVSSNATKISNDSI